MGDAMNVRNEYFSASLITKIEATDVYLPLSMSAEADLKALLETPDAYVYLTLKDDLYLETVKVKNVQGTLMMERGVEGTVATSHPYGTCVAAVSPTIVALIKDLICNYECCEGPCPVEPVALAGYATPTEGNVGVEWTGAVIFSGTAPMTIVVNSAPSWMEAVQIGSTIKLRGVPDKTGTTVMTVAATNGNGTNVVSTALEVVIKN